MAVAMRLLVAWCLTCVQAAGGAWSVTSLDYFRAHVGEMITGASLGQPFKSTSAAQCGELCLAHDECISFNIVNTSDAEASPLCGLNGWSENYTVVKKATSTYFFKKLVLDKTPVQPKIKYTLEVPEGGIALAPGTAFADGFTRNMLYLGQFPVEDLLYWFRERSGNGNPAGASSWGWDNGGPDKPYGLRGSVAGAFLMGAGGTVRWVSNETIGSRLRAVVNGIADNVDNSSGYIMAFPMNESIYHENPNYVTSWVTHGLLEASIGDPIVRNIALRLLRGHFDWLDTSSNLPLYLPPRGADQTPFPNVRGKDADPVEVQQFDNGHLIYIIYQGMIHNSRLALSSVGIQSDVDVLYRYSEDWWLNQLASKNSSAIWLRSYYPHNYEITSIEAYMDLYQITGDIKYLNAVDGFWDMFKESFLHLGGTVAIKEWKLYPPKSYYIDTTGEDAHGRNPGHNNCPLLPSQNNSQCWHSTGELCGQTFWIKLAQRLHRLRPFNEDYVTQIEQSLLNGVLSQIPPNGSGIRQFAVLHKVKMVASNISTCCEGQGTRALGSLPEYIYSFDRENHATFINIYSGSTLIASKNVSGIVINSTWPYAYPNIRITIQITSLGTTALSLRIPSWAGPGNISLAVHSNDTAPGSTYSGAPGTYLRISRKWDAGDTVSFSLPHRLKAHNYTGLTQITGHQRYAVTIGSVLLAAVGGAWDTKIDSMLIDLTGLSDPQNPEAWLTAAEGNNLKFVVKGSQNQGISFIPYMDVQDELFEVYPAFKF